MVAVDGFRFAALAFILVATAATILLSLGYLEREGLIAPSTTPGAVRRDRDDVSRRGGGPDRPLPRSRGDVGGGVRAGGLQPGSVFSAEAALKYFLIGAFASAFLLYGIALVWGATGSTSLAGDRAGQTGGAPLPVIGKIGLGLLLIGMGFKVASVPFHMWAPDVYDGAPTPVTGYMATGVKAAGFLALVRILKVAFPEAHEAWQPVVAGLAIATMVLGNLVALAQRSLKRMLAYSSIAHAGYLLVSVWAGTRWAPRPRCSTSAPTRSPRWRRSASWRCWAGAGSGRSRSIRSRGWPRAVPGSPFALAVCMLSLLGFPGTLGFVGKWAILASVVEARQLPLAVILVVTSLISAGYYLPGDHGGVHAGAGVGRGSRGGASASHRGARGRGGDCRGPGVRRAALGGALVGRRHGRHDGAVHRGSSRRRRALAAPQREEALVNVPRTSSGSTTFAAWWTGS